MLKHPSLNIICFLKKPRSKYIYRIVKTLDGFIDIQKLEHKKEIIRDHTYIIEKDLNQWLKYLKNIEGLKEINI